MDADARFDCTTIKNHAYFTGDAFSATFPAELAAKVKKENRGNPLLAEADTKRDKKEKRISGDREERRLAKQMAQTKKYMSTPPPPLPPPATISGAGGAVDGGGDGGDDASAIGCGKGRYSDVRQSTPPKSKNFALPQLNGSGTGTGGSGLSGGFGGGGLPQLSSTSGGHGGHKQRQPKTLLAAIPPFKGGQSVKGRHSQLASIPPFRGSGDDSRTAG